MEFAISVIVPVYNSEKNIINCLKSIYFQTIDTLELIIVNDGSTDKSYELIQKFMKMYLVNEKRNIITINKENGGPSSARNTGIDVAKGKYIAFVDSDDFIEKDMYKSLVSIAEKNCLDVVMCNIMNIYKNDKQIKSPELVPIDTILSRKDIVSMICPTLMREDIFGGPCNRIYKREFIEKNNIRMPEEIGYGEDAIFQMQVFDKLDSTWFSSQCYYKYIHRENSQSSPKPGRFKNTLEPLYKYRMFYGKKWNIDKELISNYFVYCTIMDIINTLFNKKYKKKKNYLEEVLKSKCLKNAINISKITKNMYTQKIYFCFLCLKILINLKKEI